MDVKINVLVSIKGSKKYTANDCIKTVVDENGNESTYFDYTMTDCHKMVVGGTEKGPDIINFHTYKCKPAQQSINMSQAAYDAFIDAENPARGYVLGKWKQMSKKQRVEAHLKDVADSLDGVVENYEVYND